MVDFLRRLRRPRIVDRAGEVRSEYFPFCAPKEEAHVLIFPDLQSGNLAMHLLHTMGEAVVVGTV